ncbi:hypothetical protein CBM2592_A160242 [Cupriavidus taiwanensis]|nr:hypothetical protein CBM2592_A160242 [Cupriavidus taiwanensis]SOY81317.1 hypothetical protein CBM2591_A190241 [Cupriavidus taiwanensis]SOZ54314.1 hypothetical protein CBM2617_A170153 [Cupriavidus taiwanensis]SOZ78269.1 hypothetical protein CBM2618_A160322 [Cupriavidus taiwanensis]SOZ84166.1 hypothetical protein CBM2621_A150321 [Cupriavidus taiwanensis]
MSPAGADCLGENLVADSRRGGVLRGAGGQVYPVVRQFGVVADGRAGGCSSLAGARWWERPVTGMLGHPGATATLYHVRGCSIAGASVAPAGDPAQ